MSQTQQSPYAAAVVGGGFIGPVHVEALRRLGVPVLGILDATPELAAPVAERLGLPKVYRDLQELVADKDVRVVHVASPNNFHYPQAKALIEGGKHVLCEKPLAISSSETAELVKLAKSRPQQAAAVNYNVRFYPICHEMKARVARGDIGKVLSATGSYTQDWLLLESDYNWRVEPDGGSNLRAIADIGTHWMDLTQFITGQHISAVCADVATFHPTRIKPAGKAESFGGPAKSGVPVPITTEDFGAVQFQMDGGARGVYFVSQALAGRKNRLYLEIAGTEGSLVWDSENPDALWIGRRGRTSELLMRDPSILSPEAAAIANYPGGHAEGFPDTFKQLKKALHGWIESGLKGPAPVPTFEDGHKEVVLCETIAASARNRGWVNVPAAATV
jgi:predicted dehydrogenase